MPASKRKNSTFKSGARKVSAKKPAAKITRVRKRNIMEIHFNKNKKRQRGNKMNVEKGRGRPRKIDVKRGRHRKVPSFAKYERSPLLDKGEAVVSLRRCNYTRKDPGTRRCSGRILSQINLNDISVYVS